MMDSHNRHKEKIKGPGPCFLAGIGEGGGKRGKVGKK